MPLYGYECCSVSSFSFHATCLSWPCPIFCPPPPWLAMPLALRYSMHMFYNLFYRHILASLHFNENINRESQTAKDGNVYVHVTYPKFKLGDEVVREVSVPPTYGEFSFFLCITTVTSQASVISFSF